MKKILSISAVIFLFLNFSAKSNAEEVKDCFEGLNRATFAFNQGVWIKQFSSLLQKDIENYQCQ